VQELKPYDELSQGGKWARDHPEYKEHNKKHLKEYKREYRLNNKLRVLEHYSNGAMACAVCGKKNINFLTVDHINGGGCRHRREVNADMLYWLERKYRTTGIWPKGYQVLCANHNFIKKFEENGYAPNNQTLAIGRLIIEIRHLLGEKCEICGFEDARALHIDHVNGGGLEELRSFSGTYAYYKNIHDKILAGSRDYQLLCANHNLEKELSKREAR
jgi:hypothetical protein